MKQKVIFFLRYALVLILAVGIVMASGSKILSHNPADLMQIVTDHQIEAVDQGHAHEDIVDIVHAYDGHAHDIADHDHSPALLPAWRGASALDAARRGWPMVQLAASGRKPIGLERPPRC
jgi:hypothetical protein